MNRLFTAYLASLCLLLIAGNRSEAQFPLRLGASVGANFANQAFSPDFYPPENPQRFHTGLVIGGLAEVGISGIWSLQFEPKYVERGTRFLNIVTTGTVPTPTGTTDATFKLNYFEFPLLVKAGKQSRELHPFFIAGPALGFNTSARVEAPGTNVHGQPNTSTIDLSKDVNSVDVTLNIGGGVEFPISTNAAFLLDLRYSRGLSDVYSNPAVPSAKSYGIALTAGVLLNIFESTTSITESVATAPSKLPLLDTDGDGLTDSDEINIYKTNPRLADTDGDRLTDGEEVLTYKTNPLNPDTDGDGLSDGDEVKDYKTDPLDPDTDHGGIKDGPEVVRGSNPLDPSDDFPKKEVIKIDVGKSVVLDGVVFKTGSAEIGPASAAILEKAYNTLQQNLNVYVEIRGHTDNVGKRAYNMKLSLSRANAVKDYLVQRGIEPKRIATKGFGFDKPIEDNGTPEGRQKNRRIEFYRVR